MYGGINKAQSKLKPECPQSLYIHSCNHALDLVLQEVAKEVLIAEALNFVQGAAMVIGKLHKRKTFMKSLFGLNEVVKNLVSLCSTR